MTETSTQTTGREIAAVASLRKADRFRLLGSRLWATVQHRTALTISGNSERGDWAFNLDEHGTHEAEIERGTYVPPEGTVRITAYTFDQRRYYTGNGDPWAWFADYDLRRGASRIDAINANVPYAWADQVAQLLAADGPAGLTGPWHRLAKGQTN